MDQHRRSECAVSVRLPWRVFVCVLAMSAGCGQGSGSSGTGGSPGSGGATSSGGSPGSGGTSSSGGTTGSGGITASGGATGSGGATSTGGATGSGGSKASGGATGSGGATSAGGTTGSGGATSSGGVTGSGGATASGGNSGSGGVAGSGGKAGSGGATSTGGATGTGGASGTGGAAGAPDTTGALGSQAAVPSAGCGTTSTLTFGKDPNETGGACTKYPGGNCSGSQPGYGAGGWLTIKSSDSANGRGFDVRLPDNYDNTKPYPLYFGFHWRGGTANQVDNGGSNGYWWSYYGIQRKSNNGFIFVAPQGIGNGWSDASDLTFVDDMVSLIEKNYCVDTTRLVSSGFSFGAGMSYALACARAKVFHAVVLYEGGVISGCNNPATDPIAFMQIEGLTDTTLSISGAYPMRDKFVTNNGCSPLASSLDKPGSMAEPPNPPPYLSSGGHICTNYSGCSAGHPLRWCVSQSGHGPGPIDGTSDLYNSCATSPGCSASCPCTWTPDDVWSWLTTSEAAGTSFQTPNATK